jgi:toxin ParE1/3/4
MSFPVVLRPEAEADIADAAMWYDNQREGLGGDFVEAIFRAVDVLSENPQLVSRRHRQRDIRWARPDRFPYRIIYEIADDVVLIICVLHSARDEHHWQERLTDS